MPPLPPTPAAVAAATAATGGCRCRRRRRRFRRCGYCRHCRSRSRRLCRRRPCRRHHTTWRRQDAGPGSSAGGKGGLGIHARSKHVGVFLKSSIGRGSCCPGRLPPVILAGGRGLRFPSPKQRTLRSPTVGWKSSPRVWPPTGAPSPLRHGCFWIAAAAGPSPAVCRASKAGRLSGSPALSQSWGPPSSMLIHPPIQGSCSGSSGCGGQSTRAATRQRTSVPAMLLIVGQDPRRDATGKGSRQTKSRQGSRQTKSRLGTGRVSPPPQQQPPEPVHGRFRHRFVAPWEPIVPPF